MWIAKPPSRILRCSLYIRHDKIRIVAEVHTYDSSTWITERSWQRSAFTLYLKDEENGRKGYMWSTETGTEEVLRGALAKGGMPEPKIDVLFAHAAELGVKENRSGEQI